MCVDVWNMCVCMCMCVYGEICVYCGVCGGMSGSESTELSMLVESSVSSF